MSSRKHKPRRTRSRGGSTCRTFATARTSAPSLPAAVVPPCSGSGTCRGERGAGNFVTPWRLGRSPGAHSKMRCAGTQPALAASRGRAHDARLAAGQRPNGAVTMDDEAKALLEVGRMLRAADYHFTAVTPETHRRVNARAERCGTPRAKSL